MTRLELTPQALADALAATAQAPVDPGGRPLAVVGHWSYLKDLDEGAGGGFVSGELTLTDDGAVHDRTVTDSTGSAGTTIRVGAWRATAFTSVRTTGELEKTFADRHYQLRRPAYTDLAVDRRPADG